MSSGDFPGGLVLKTLCISNVRDVGSIPIWGTKIPLAQWYGQKKKKSLLCDIFCNKHTTKRKKNYGMLHSC